MPRVKKEATEAPSTALRYTDADMQKLDQFACSLLRDGTGNLPVEGAAQRVRDAYEKARVMLDISKTIAKETVNG